MKVIFACISLLILIVAGFWYYLSKTYPETETLTSAQYFAEHLIKPHTKLDKHILGFLPYWRLDDSKYIRPNELSEINYFSFSIDTDGHIAKAVNGETDPGWNGWTKQTTKDFITKSQIMGADVTITVTVLDNALIEAILNNNTMQENLITDTTKEITTHKLNGVNIDFEYTGEPALVYRQEFTSFSKKLESQLKHQSSNAKLSLSIMPLAGSKKDLYDFPKITSIYDRFIGMSYDYYGKNADIAGPIAPMKGFKENKYFFDITTTYEDYLKYIPKEKLAMGIPYYGWEWAVLDGKKINSKTLAPANPNNYTAIISYARGREDTDIKKNQCYWDDYALETWCWYTDKTSGTDRQLWPVDNRFIQTRFTYAKKQHFGGIAIWTLGLDKNYPDLWDMIKTTFKK